MRFLPTLAKGIGIAAIAAAMLSAASAEKVLRVVPHADLKNVDPIWTTAYITRNHGYMVYDTLFGVNEKGEVQPQMVGKYSLSDDKLTWTFTLRDGLKWHDGDPVTTADIIPSIQRWGKRDGAGQKLMDLTAEMKAVDDKTFTLTLKEPYGFVLDSLGKISSNTPFMMKKKYAEVDAFTQVTEIVGSGPFKFVQEEWVPGSKVVYIKNEDYVPRSEPASGAAGGKVVKVDRVEWVYIPDPATTMNALQNGEVDYWETPAPDMLPLMRTNDNLVIKVIDPLGTQGWLRMNHLHAPFDNPKVRKAILMAVQQETYLQAIVGDPAFYRTCKAYYMCGSPNETTAGDMGYLEGNMDAAKKILEEEGVVGHKIVLMQPTDIPLLSSASLVTAQMLRDLGFDVEMQAMDWSTLTSRRAEKKSPADGGWNVFHTYATGADAQTPVTNIGTSAGGVERAWFGWPTDKRVEDLRDAWAKEGDLTKRAKITDELQARLFEVIPFVNYGQWYQPVAWRKGLTGVLLAPVPFFWNIEVPDKK
jgi:peptide/nickel transport system substrate-binding protein